jgi:hypothetical protein
MPRLSNAAHLTPSLDTTPDDQATWACCPSCGQLAAVPPGALFCDTCATTAQTSARPARRRGRRGVRS